MKRRWVSLERLLTPGRRWHLLAMLLVLVGAFAVRVRNIEAALPYCRHVDESTWVKIALNMLRTGDLNPHRFRKPSLPVYVMAAGFSVGYLDARMRGEVHTVAELGTTSEPFYAVPRAALPPKLLFALASVLALGLAGFTGASLVGRPAMLWLTPLIGSLSNTYMRMSWSYMTVDVIGTLFVWATLAYLARARVRGLSLTKGQGWLARFMMLGVLAGLAVGSKYNLFPVLVPGVLWFALIERERWFRHTVLLGALAVLVFFATTPFALVTPRHFIADVLREMHHYATGHGGRSIARGLPMLLVHFQHFRQNFGLLPLLLASLGVVFCFRRDARLSALVFSYALVFVSYMSLQRVFFERNMTAVHLHVALALAAFIVELPDWLVGVVRARWGALGPSRVRAAAMTAGVALLLVGLPWRVLAFAYSGDVDPRVRATAWLASRLEHRPLLIVDPALNLDVRPLLGSTHIEEVDPVRAAAHLQRRPRGERHLVVLTRPTKQAAVTRVSPGLRRKAQFEPDRPLSDFDDGIVVLSR
jgi:hypothetical protein